MNIDQKEIEKMRAILKSMDKLFVIYDFIVLFVYIFNKINLQINTGSWYGNTDLHVVDLKVHMFEYKIMSILVQYIKSYITEDKFKPHYSFMDILNIVLIFLGGDLHISYSFLSSFFLISIFRNILFSYLNDFLNGFFDRLLEHLSEDFSDIDKFINTIKAIEEK